MVERDYKIKSGTMTSIAEAIKTQTGDDTPLFPKQMASQIKAIKDVEPISNEEILEIVNRYKKRG